MSAPPEQLDEDAAALVGRFAVRCGIARGAPVADVQAAIAAYLQKKPLNEDIVAAVHAIAREKLAEGNLGAAVQKFTGVLGGDGERPKGTVPAGPMARFLVDKKK